MYKLSIEHSDNYAIILREYPELAADNRAVTRRKLLHRGTIYTDYARVGMQ